MGILISLYSVVKELDKFFWGGGIFWGDCKKKERNDVGVVGLLYLCGLIGEMCAQLFCISGMGAN